MYKTKKKPDLLVILAVFVGLGVFISTYTLSVGNNTGSNSGTPAAETADTDAAVRSPVKPSKTVKEIQPGDLLKVSYPLYTPLPTEIKI